MDLGDKPDEAADWFLRMLKTNMDPEVLTEETINVLSQCTRQEDLDVIVEEGSEEDDRSIITARELKEELLEILKGDVDVNENQKADDDIATRSAIRGVIAFSSKCLTAIKKRRTTLVNEVQSIAEEKEKNLQDHIDLLKSTRSELKASIMELKTGMNTEPEKLIKTIEKAVEISEKFEQVDLKRRENCTVVFIPNPKPDL